MEPAPTFKQELEDLINRHSKENGSNTPDFILADYLNECLEVFNKTMKQREAYYGRAFEYREYGDSVTTEEPSHD